MEKNHNKIRIALLAIIILILSIYTIFVLVRWSTLSQLSAKNREKNEKDNYYISVKYDSVTRNFWRKGEVYKSEIIIPANTGDTAKVVFWYNTKTNETYRYEDGKYQEDKNAQWEVMPNYIFDINFPSKENETWARLLYASNPFNSMKTEEYDTKSCYVFKKENDKLKEERYIEKDTGLCIRVKSEANSTYHNNDTLSNEKYNSEYSIQYRFDTVEDKEIER